MRIAIMTLTTAALALARMEGAAAQSAGPSDTLTPATVLLERAEELHREHRMDDAIELYHEAVLAMDDASDLPLVPLQRIATIHLSAGRADDAAAAMDRLASRAEWLGYPEVQAKALLESAALHQQAGARGAAWERVQRLQPLLGSPHLDAETLARIRSRLRVSTATR